MLAPEASPQFARVEPLSTAFSDELERREVQRTRARRTQRSAFIRAVSEHAYRFREYHKARLEAQKRMAADIAAKQQAAQREKDKAAEKAERERLRHLRASDAEAYQRMLEEAKTERLKYLMAQTDSFLEELGSKVAELRGEGAADAAAAARAAAIQMGRESLKASEQAAMQAAESAGGASAGSGSGRGDGAGAGSSESDDDDDDDDEDGSSGRKGSKDSPGRGGKAQDLYYLLAHRQQERVSR